MTPCGTERVAHRATQRAGQRVAQRVAYTFVSADMRFVSDVQNMYFSERQVSCIINIHI